LRVNGQPFGLAGVTLEGWGQRGRDRSSIVADPLFVGSS